MENNSSSKDEDSLLDLNLAPSLDEEIYDNMQENFEECQQSKLSNKYENFFEIDLNHSPFSEETSNFNSSLELELYDITQASSIMAIPSLPNTRASPLIDLNFPEDGEKHVDKTYSTIFPNTTEAFTTTETFANKDELIDWCRNTGKKIGLVVIIGRSDSFESGRRPRLSLTCEKSGQFRPKKPKVIDKLIVSSKRTRNVGTKKCGCPFMLKGSKYNNGEWKLTVVDGTHNHTIGNNLVGHAYVGRLLPDERVLVSELSEAGVRPRDMLTFLKKRNPGNLSTRSTLYNYRSKHNLTNLQGRSQMQQLLHNLDQFGYDEFHRDNSITGECTDLLFAHPESIQVAHAFPEVLIMDCTYKTNLHRLPLLEVVGFTSTLKTFSICFAYLDSEKEESFVWALQRLYDILETKASSVNVIMTDRDLALMNAVAKVFPKATHLLCRWHVENNIISNCKKSFKTNEDFEKFMEVVADLMRSRNEVEYNNRLDGFKKSYAKLGSVVNYVLGWLKNYKERFVSAWTDSVMHFDTHTTNRVESQHSSLKRHLDSSNGNLLQNWKVVDNLIHNQLTEIRRTFNMSRGITRHSYQGKPYTQIKRLIAKEALDLLAKELRRSNFVGDEKSCGCVLRRTCGLPCAHELNEMVKLGDGYIRLASIHPRWRKLEILPIDLHRGSMDIRPELAAIEKRFGSLSEHEQLMLLKKCMELADPKTTFLEEPQKKTALKGRPSTSKISRKKSKKDESTTRREPSAFEYAQTLEEQKAGEQVEEVVLKKRGRPRKNTCENYQELVMQKSSKKRGRPPKNNGKLIEFKELKDVESKWEHELYELNPLIRDYIVWFENVDGDGHCGYRSITKLRGYNTMEGWMRVRQEMLEELIAYQWEYKVCFGFEGFDSHMKNLQCRAKSTNNRNEWFDLPDMGTLVANVYNCVFLCLGSDNSDTTYLPWRTTPTPEVLDMMTVGHINNKTHFVPLVLVRDAPLPPLVPGWNSLSMSNAKPWFDLIKDQLEDWELRIRRFNVNANYGDIPIEYIQD